MPTLTPDFIRSCRKTLCFLKGTSYYGLHFMQGFPSFLMQIGLVILTTNAPSCAMVSFSDLV